MLGLGTRGDRARTCRTPLEDDKAGWRSHTAKHENSLNQGGAWHECWQGRGGAPGQATKATEPPAPSSCACRLQRLVQRPKRSEKREKAQRWRRMGLMGAQEVQRVFHRCNCGERLEVTCMVGSGVLPAANQCAGIGQPPSIRPGRSTGCEQRECLSQGGAVAAGFADSVSRAPQGGVRHREQACGTETR